MCLRRALGCGRVCANWRPRSSRLAWPGQVALVLPQSSELQDTEHKQVSFRLTSRLLRVCSLRLITRLSVGARSWRCTERTGGRASARSLAARLSRGLAAGRAARVTERGSCPAPAQRVRVPPGPAPPRPATPPFRAAPPRAPRRRRPALVPIQPHLLRLCRGGGSDRERRGRAGAEPGSGSREDPGGGACGTAMGVEIETISPGDGTGRRAERVPGGGPKGVPGGAGGRGSGPEGCGCGVSPPSPPGPEAPSASPRPRHLGVQAARAGVCSRHRPGRSVAAAGFPGPLFPSAFPALLAGSSGSGHGSARVSVSAAPRGASFPCALRRASRRAGVPLLGGRTLQGRAASAGRLVVAVPLPSHPVHLHGLHLQASKPRPPTRCSTCLDGPGYQASASPERNSRFPPCPPANALLGSLLPD